MRISRNECRNGLPARNPFSLWQNTDAARPRVFDGRRPRHREPLRPSESASSNRATPVFRFVRASAPSALRSCSQPSKATDRGLLDLLGRENDPRKWYRSWRSPRSVHRSGVAVEHRGSFADRQSDIENGRHKRTLKQERKRRFHPKRRGSRRHGLATERYEEKSAQEAKRGVAQGRDGTSAPSESGSRRREAPPPALRKRCPNGCALLRSG